MPKSPTSLAASIRSRLQMKRRLTCSCFHKDGPQRAANHLLVLRALRCLHPHGRHRPYLKDHFLPVLPIGVARSRSPITGFGTVLKPDFRDPLQQLISVLRRQAASKEFRGRPVQHIFRFPAKNVNKELSALPYIPARWLPGREDAGTFAARKLDRDHPLRRIL